MSNAIFTIVSEDYDLKNVRDIKKLLVESGFPVVFPITIECKCRKGKLVIRSLDDFPYKSKKCSSCGFYLIKLVKVEDGEEEIL